MVDVINRDKQDKTTAMPLLPLRDVVVFPHMIVPLFVGRERSIFALESAMKYEKSIFLVAQKNAKKDEPHEEDIYTVGYCVCLIEQSRFLLKDVSGA
jgi:ATP-dependent Lon protease